MGERERGCCVGEIKLEKETRQRGARAWGGQGAPGARGPSWAGPGRAAPRVKIPRHAQPQIGRSIREQNPKTKLRNTRDQARNQTKKYDSA
jgi:hypothetical protein